MRKRPFRPRPKEAVLPKEVVLEVEMVGARGDGLATLDGQPVFLPLTLAGDKVRARVEGGRGEVVEFLHKAPRREPPCPHFGTCGGCALQHMPEAGYAAFSAARIEEALSKKGFGILPLEDTATSPPGSRRRITLAYERRGKVLTLGYHARRSRGITGIQSCLIALSELEALIEPLAALLSTLNGAAGKVVLTASDTGVDALITGIADLSLAEREALSGFALAHDLARLSVASEQEPGAGQPETVVQARAPMLTMGGRPVPLSPAGFLQATRQGEAALVKAVTDWVTGKVVADLFAGCGTFSLPLVAGHQVTAVETDATLLASLLSAGGGRIKTQERDLFVNPLTGGELNRFDTVIMDPPRAGALAQTQALANSDVKSIIAISCNPATFARDARILVDGGYDLVSIRPVDQFLWSAHVELAALFRR